MRNEMLAMIIATLLSITGVAAELPGWETICTMPGNGVGSVGFFTMNLKRRPRGDGLYDYLIDFPVAITDTCQIPGQYPHVHVSATFYLTQNEVMASGDNEFHHGTPQFQSQFTARRFNECIDADYTWKYECKF